MAYGPLVTYQGHAHTALPQYTTQVSLLFQSPPKGPTIPYKPQQFSVPPPSPHSPTLSDSSMVMSSSASYVSPPPPQCPPQGSLPMGAPIDSYLPPMFPQQPLPFPPMAPCLRYSAFPGPAPLYTLALQPQDGLKQGPIHAGPLQFCPQVPEASCVQD